MTLSASAKAFRSALLALGPRAKNSPFPPHLRQLALAHLQLALRKNIPPQKAAKQLGLCLDSLLRWQAEAAPLFHEITLAPLPSPPSPPLFLSVSGPRGLQLHGLDLDTVVALWNKLSC